MLLSQLIDYRGNDDDNELDVVDRQDVELGPRGRGSQMSNAAQCPPPPSRAQK